MSDEEAIAMAMLLGCTFWENGMGSWFIISDDDDDDKPFHPLEDQRYDEWALTEREHRPGKHWGWETRAELAHDYIKWWRAEQARNHAA